MRTRTKILAVAAAAAIITAIASTAFILTLKPPTIQGISIKSIDAISLKGCNITVVLKLHNPNIIGVSLDSITYTLKLTKGNTVLTTGAIDGIKIPANGNVDIPIKMNVQFSPIITLILQALVNKSVMMNISGVVTLSLLHMSVPFSMKFDAYKYLSKYLG